MTDKTVTEYWLKHYVQDDMCSLCGQIGLIDTRSVSTPAGFFCGRVNFCICPNGQTLRANPMGYEAEIMLGGYKTRTNARLKDV